MLYDHSPIKGVIKEGRLASINHKDTLMPLLVTSLAMLCDATTGVDRMPHIRTCAPIWQVISVPLKF